MIEPLERREKRTPATAAASAGHPVRAPRARSTSEYALLLAAVREAGLLERCRGFYVTLFGALAAALAAVVVGVIVVGDSWWQLLLAVALGPILAQLGFLAHEAAHREVFVSGKANDWAGRVVADLLVGISFSWWKVSHNRHHSNPNLVGKDPSVDRGVFSFTEEDAALAQGARAWYTRRQGYFFFPVLLGAGLNLYIQGFRTVFGRGMLDKRWAEIVMLLVRNIAFLVALFTVLPVGKALAFLGVQLAVFGLATASSFVPNHVGMPILPRDAKVDFLRRQVLTSRNITGGWMKTAWMGGLNYQIEHHLFPSMPRPHLRRARMLALQFCAERDIRYTETRLRDAYRIIVRSMNEVGLAAVRDPYRCPVASSLGR